MKIKKFLIVLLACLTLGVATVGLASCDEDSAASSSSTPPTGIENGAPEEGGLNTLTVTYDANGGVFANGGATFTQEVSANSSLTAPTSPKRTNYTFAGWATDKNGGATWAFDTDKATQNITLYAVWKEVIAEYDVTFVLNYADADNVVRSTENGLIGYVPQRDGYVFNGWWLSDGETENGYILSQKYDTTQRVTENGLTLYAEWVEESTVSAQLLAPSVSINESTFSWNAITGAQSYNIRIYETGNSEALYNQSTTATTWTFPSSYEEGYYTVKIRANGDGENTVNSAFVTKSYAHRILGSISSIDFDISTSVLTWTAVKYATEYELYLNNTFVETLNYTTFDMSDYEAGEYEVKIIAERTNYQSSTTQKTIEKKRLKTPELSLLINDEDDSYDFSWEPVNHANLYILTLNGEEIRLTDCAYSLDNASAYWNGKENITYTLKAFDENADYLVSNPTEEQMLDKVYFLNCLNTEGGTISYTAKHLAPNTVATLTATTKKGYVWLGWYNGETKVTDELSYTFAMPAENVTYRAKWKIAEEMKNFYFTSTETTCSITGIKDETVTEIIVPDYVTSISKGAFSGCSSLESITLPFVGGTKTTNTYSGYIFGASSYSYNDDYVPTSLKEVIITSATSIGNYAFDECSSLTSVTIGEGVTSIGYLAFYDCYKLIEVYNKSSLEITAGNSGNGYVGYYAKNVYTPTSGESKLSTDSNGYIIYTDGEDKILVGYVGNETALTLPSGITEIYKYAFEDCSSLTSITIPDGVTSIGKFAFYNCSRLTSVTIPDSVTSIGKSAFYNCSRLTSITIPFVAGGIFGYIFGGSSSSDNEDYVPTSLKEVIITSATSIGNWAFDGCSSLTSITIPDSVTSIGNGAFRYCSSLTSVTIPNSVTSIGYYAFGYCYSLTSITIPDGVTFIDYWAFERCSSLTIYCEATSKPSGWSSTWNGSNCPVVWGYTGEE